MTTVLTATTRGQVTLPKAWRDQFDGRHFEAEIDGDQIIIKPLNTKKSLEHELEAAWQDYKNGGRVYTHEEMMEQYGL